MQFIDVKNGDGRTPLHCAAKNGHLNIVKRFVSVGANTNIVDNDGKTAFDLAKTHIEVASYLAHSMSRTFQAEEKYEDALKIYEELLEIQEKELGYDDPETAKTRNYIGSLQAILHATGLSDKEPPATYSFMKDLEEKNKGGRKPLHAAAKNGYFDILKMLVGAGANINVVDNDGKTAFDLGKDHIEVASFLAHRMLEIFQAERKYGDALKISEELFEIQKEKLGRDHPDTMETREYADTMDAKMRALDSDGRSTSFLRIV